MINKKILAAVILMSVIQMGTVVISSVLTDIAMAFPGESDASVQFLMTFPSLAIMIASIASASLSKILPKKYLCFIGLVLFALSGVLSWAVHTSFWQLFVWAGMMGIGVGLDIPITLSLIADCFPGDKQQMIMGLQSSAANAGAMIMTFVGGWLAESQWSLTYLAYLVAIPGAVLALLCVPVLTSGKKTSADASDGVAGGSADSLKSAGEKLKSTGENPRKKSKGIPTELVNAFVLAFFATMLYNNVPVNISMLITEQGTGTASTAGMATALLLASCAVTGLFFGKLVSKLGKYVVALAFTCICTGHIILSLSTSLPLTIIGCLIAGASLSICLPQATFEATNCQGIKSEVGATISMTGSYLGALSTPVITILAEFIFGSGSSAKRMLLSGIIAAAYAIAFVVISLLSKKKTDIN